MRPKGSFTETTETSNGEWNVPLSQGFDSLPNLLRNLPVPLLVERALASGEGALVSSGALAVWTGKYTGRSPEDRFLVKDDKSASQIAWGGPNQPIDAADFDRLYRRVLAYLARLPAAYLFDGFAGADPEYRMPVRVVTEYAWHSLFVRQLLRRPTPEELSGFEPGFTLVCAPGCQADPNVDPVPSESFILIDLERRLGVIGGTRYAGEMKKMVFTVMNYMLPERAVLPMHCSANVGEAGDVALFFGLSGTGKTSLSADPHRRLIGDDEHGWSERGIFNIEGGCYAKTHGLSREKEPQIWEAIRFGAILENVDVDETTREIDFDSVRYTENARAAYPLTHAPGAVLEGVGGHPRTVVFLTADASGVLPPIARLNINQAMYHFLTGYTSKLAGTERGVDRPQPTFSPCFGAPFLPRPPAVYARMLGERLRKHRANVYLVNTGWVGGGFGRGRRIDLEMTRAMVRAALSGRLASVDSRIDPIFGFAVPTKCPGVPAWILEPRRAWDDPERYDREARALAAAFRDHMAKLQGVDETVLAAGPVVP